MNTNKRKNLLATFVAVFAAGATAQNDFNEPASAQTALEEIIVTAQKRAESLQDVPISVTALSGKDLVNAGVDSSMDLERIVPGLVVSDFGRNGNITLRGIGAPFNQGPGTDNSISTYIDGAYQSRFSSALLDLMDLERVEVLRGPQGVLNGRNSTGGSIHYYSKSPAEELSGQVAIEAGNYGLRKFKGSVDIPLIDDELLFRASMMRTTRDGYTENLSDPSDDHDRDDLLAGRVTLKYLPTETLDITLHGTFTDDDGDFAAWKMLNLDETSLLAGATQIDDPRKVMTNTGPRIAPMRNWNIDATVKWDLSWAVLTSISAYSDVSVGPFRYDVDATEIPVLNQGEENKTNGLVEDAKTVSQEFLLSSQGEGRLNWVVGAYYLKDKQSWLTGIEIPPFSLPLISFDASTEVDGYATFGHIAYDLTDKIRINTGLRYSYEEKTNTSSQLLGFETVAGPVTQSKSWDAWTPKFGLDYFISDNTMMYISASKGFKSGAFNPTGVGEPPVNPETNNAYEIGLKSTMLNDRLRLNLSVFDYDYTDLQVQSVDSNVQLAFQNSGEAEIQGLEVEITALPTDKLKLDVALSLLDAEYVEFVSLDENGLPISLAGNTLPNSPDFTASVGIEYTQPINGWGHAIMRTDYYYSDEKFFNEFNDPVRAYQKAYGLWNARISFESLEGSWNLSLFGKNLTDEVLLSTTFVLPDFFGEGYVGFLNAPRTFGAEFEYNF